MALGGHRSLGSISQTLQAAGQAAATYQATLPLPPPVWGEADEIFQGWQPALTVVDGRSFLVLHLAPLRWLEQTLACWREGLDEETETLILWAWQHQQTLGLTAGEGSPPALQPVVRAFWEALSLFHRSSSLAESLHSWLYPHLRCYHQSEFYRERFDKAGMHPDILTSLDDLRRFPFVTKQLYGGWGCDTIKEQR